MKKPRPESNFFSCVHNIPVTPLTRHWSGDNPLRTVCGLTLFRRASDGDTRACPVILHCVLCTHQPDATCYPRAFSCRIKIPTLVTSYLLGKSGEQLMQALLDCSSLPPVIAAAQEHCKCCFGPNAEIFQMLNNLPNDSSLIFLIMVSQSS